MAGFTDFVRNQYADLPVPEPPADIANETYVVTGANSGLGRECVKHLFRMGAGRVILAVRSLEKGETALAAIRGETGSATAGEVWELDLASLDSVEAFARRLSTLDRLDALIANAGVVTTRFQAVEGLELSLLVNVVSTMLLGIRALPKLRESATRFGVQPRLVIVSSRTALDSKMKHVLEGLRGDVFDALSSKQSFSTFVQYPMTKLLEIFAVRQLASVLPASESGVIVNTVNPGLCYSDLDRNGSFGSRMAMVTMRKILARTAEEGSRNLLQAAFAGPQSHGAYCSECQIKDQVVPDWIRDEFGTRMQKRVWDDLLKTLATKGHGVDITALLATPGSR